MSQNEDIGKLTNSWPILLDHFRLTDRELDVLEWVIEGAENKLVASELSISLGTVKTHLIHIFKKFNVNSRAKLLAKIYEDIGNSSTLK